MEITKVIKIVVLGIFLVFTGYWTFKYLAKGADLLAYLTQFPRDMLKKGIDKSFDIAGLDGWSIKKTITSTFFPSKETPIERASTLEDAVDDGAVGYPENQFVGDSANSPIQNGPIKGYCYVGNDRGIRSCIGVNNPYNCMSGEIFPTFNVCVNPTLRPGLTTDSQFYYFYNGKYRDSSYFDQSNFVGDYYYNDGNFYNTNTNNNNYNNNSYNNNYYNNAGKDARGQTTSSPTASTPVQTSLMPIRPASPAARTPQRISPSSPSSSVR